ncbi:hypothetical protein K491DRAFT_735388 [Lophiostoma macrostomum CBS 122681]|uniref:Uncharacterized protein n=1 Tax=Lophiostoma macrostomum CBS 122681 TaxID=1314788 RepID=A0A6A6SRH1_9PLEO|nr:hypothetical protein K491DRAFT_735388 [Lophiostoma macrostomum CBS 122681]
MSAQQTTYPWKGKISLGEFEARLKERSPLIFQHFNYWLDEQKEAGQIGDRYDSVKCGHRNLMRETIEGLHSDWQFLRQLTVELANEDVVKRFLSLTRSADQLRQLNDNEEIAAILEVSRLSDIVPLKGPLKVLGNLQTPKQRRADKRADELARQRTKEAQLKEQEALELFPEEMREAMEWVAGLWRSFENMTNTSEEAYKKLESKIWVEMERRMGIEPRPAKVWKIE